MSMVGSVEIQAESERSCREEGAHPHELFICPYDLETSNQKQEHAMDLWEICQEKPRYPSGGVIVKRAHLPSASVQRPA